MLENVTNFNSVDILTGDSRGLLTLFTNGQILNRRSLLENSISSIDVERDSGNSNCFIHRLLRVDCTFAGFSLTINVKTQVFIFS